jgi:hypothetical protein
VRRVLTIALLLSGVALAAPPPNADPKFRSYFLGLMRPDTNTSCCDESDCRFTASRMTPAGTWEAINQFGDWVPVPPEKIIKGKTTPTGQPILCWLPSLGVLCFVEPSAGG